MVPTTLLVFLLGTFYPIRLHGSDFAPTTETPTQQSNNHFADQSFRQLQSGEDSEEMVNQCCGRVPQFETIGYGVDGTQLRVDVGTCRQLCHKTPLRSLKRQEFDRYLKKYPNMDPVHIFLALQSRLAPANNSSSSEELDVGVDDETSQSPPASLLSLRSGRSYSSATPSASCLDEAICRPSSTRRELHFGVGGIQLSVDVVESCDCSHIPQGSSRFCSRLSKPLRLHPDTPFETVVDVGECGGSGCGDSMSCRPIRNRTVSIEGQNGVECVQVIEECACTGGCYRVKQFLKVYDYSNVFEQLENVTVNGNRSSNYGSDSSLSDNLIFSSQTPAPSTLTTSTPPNEPPLSPSQPLTKMIDIGRCEGSCESGGKQGHSDATSKCLLRSSSGSCLSSLYGAHPTCTPTKLHTHFYTDKKRGKHPILSITSCGCN